MLKGRSLMRLHELGRHGRDCHVLATWALNHVLDWNRLYGKDLHPIDVSRSTASQGRTELACSRSGPPTPLAISAAFVTENYSSLPPLQEHPPWRHFPADMLHKERTSQLGTKNSGRVAGAAQNNPGALLMELRASHW